MTAQRRYKSTPLIEPEILFTMVFSIMLLFLVIAYNYILEFFS
jgi:hypothetical protein